MRLFAASLRLFLFELVVSFLLLLLGITFFLATMLLPCTLLQPYFFFLFLRRLLDLEDLLNKLNRLLFQVLKTYENINSLT